MPTGDVRYCEQCGELFKQRRGYRFDQVQKFCSSRCGNRSKAAKNRRPLIDRFWQKVARMVTGCWNWCASTNGGGYGQIWDDNKRRRIDAHRLSWEIHFGRIPEGLSVLHRCDNRLCVRPDHLFLGFQSDNIRDAWNKGRLVFGQKQWCAKLTDDDVRAIRILRLRGHSLKFLATKYGVSQSTISLVARYKRWKHVTPSASCRTTF